MRNPAPHRTPLEPFRLALLAAACLIVGGCARGTDEQPLKPMRHSQSPPRGNGWGGDKVSSLGSEQTSGRQANSRQSAPGSAEDFKTIAGDVVLFDGDSAVLTPEASKQLSQQARWLKNYAGKAVTIEGHADERGTREYNIGLGSQRAAAVRQFLIAEGVGAARIRTVSYGKERPVMTCDDLSCWSQNRRSQTILQGTAAAQK